MAAMFGAVITSSYVTRNQIPEYMFYWGKKNISHRKEERQGENERLGEGQQSGAK